MFSIQNNQLNNTHIKNYIKYSQKPSISTNRGEYYRQFGFCQNMGIRDATGMLRFMAERIIEQNRALYTCFVDYEKEFES